MGTKALGVSHASYPKTAEFQDPLFWGSPVGLCLHPLTPNDQIRHGNTYIEGRVLGQPRHCIYTCKCVARFVSDSYEFLVVSYL